jgi:hypothetical protein
MKPLVHHDFQHPFADEHPSVDAGIDVRLPEGGGGAKGVGK